MFPVFWSEIAKNDYWKNIDYLKENWSITEVKDFTRKVDFIIKTISINPKTFKTSGYINIRQVPITPHITLFYRYNEGENIELIRFWNNFQNPKSLTL
jgi:plasmid stabilization system protein ParE